MTTFAVALKRLALLLLALLPISALGSRLDFWPYTFGLLIYAIALGGSLLIEIICAIWLMQKPEQSKRTALRLASLFALPPLIIVATLMRGHTGGTMLHDITTDLATPPQFIAAVTLRGSEANSLIYDQKKIAAQNKLYPEINSLKNNKTQLENYQQSIRLAEKLGWMVHYQDPEQGHIEAIATSFWFGFKDDIVIRAKNNAIDLRSISRVGKSDLGANAGRIKEFIAKFPTKPIN